MPATLGAALGAIVVWALLDGSWPVRFGLAAAVLVVGVGVLLWRARGHRPASADNDEPAGAEPAGAPGLVDDPPGPAAYGLNPSDNQGDPTND